MSSTVRQVTEALKGFVASNFSSGSSGLDMRTAVQIGAIIEPPYIPFASLVFVQSASEFGQSLGRYRITYSFEIYGFVGGGNVQERTVNAMDLCSDIIKSITTDRQLGISTLVDDVKCAFTAEDGDRYGIEGAGIGYIQVEVYTQSDTGA